MVRSAAGAVAWLAIGCQSEPRISSDPTDVPTVEVTSTPTDCLAIEPEVLDIGDVRLADGSATATFLLGNRCPAAIDVTRFALEWPEAPFVVDALGDGLLAPEGSRTLEVAFVPTDYGPLSSRIRYRVDEPDGPKTGIVVVRGNGICDGNGGDADGDRIPDGCDVCPLGDDRVDLDGDGVARACDACPGADDRLDADQDGIPDDCDRCLRGDDTVDIDQDGIADACDACLLGDATDSDADAVPDACDLCAGSDDRVDLDGDTVPDGCDACPGFSDLADADFDTVPDACDACPGADDTADADLDTVPDGCDRCPGADDAVDADLDTVPDGCDACPGFDDRLDADGDGAPDACDACPGFDDTVDTDLDGTPEACDRCPGFSDSVDADVDGVPDGCDVCPGADDALDTDGDGVPNGCDVCGGGADDVDTDADGAPDGCDSCPGFDDAADADADQVPDGCDACPGADDGQDADLDLVPDACDVCPFANDAFDADSDGYADGCDICPGFDDGLDADGDLVPDDCDACAGFDDGVDVDGDGVPDGCDSCPEADDTADADQDGVPDRCDVCTGFDDTLDGDFDGVPDGCDTCPGFDDALDGDLDDVPDGCDVCAGDDSVDTDGDTVPDDCDACRGFDDRLDTDGDGVADDCDACAGADDAVDTDGDAIADGCDACPGFDDGLDADRDGVPDDCDSCVGAPRTETYTATAPQIDILFPADSAHPVGGFGPVFEAYYEQFLDELVASSVDWQLALLPGRWPDPNRGPGDFLGPVMHPGTPNLRAEFRQQLLRRVDGGFGALPQSFVQTTDAATQGNGEATPWSSSGFLRPGARFVVVNIEHWTHRPAGIDGVALGQRWLGFKNQDPSQVHLYGASWIRGVPYPVSCANPTPAGYAGNGFDPTTYLDLLATVPNTFVSVACRLDAGSVLAQRILADVTASGVGSALSGNPVPATLTVKVNGTPRFDWIYDRDSNRIVFDDPISSGIIEVNYREHCDGVVGGCSDGLDNDGDGLVDYPDEPGCTAPSDPSELDPVPAPACADGVDNDGDGAADYPSDTDCAYAAHDLEDCAPVDGDAYGYQLCESSTSVLPCPDLATAANRLTFGGADVVPVSLGFDVDVYGRPRSLVYVGRSGLLNFDAPLAPLANECLPNEFLDRTLATYWDLPPANVTEDVYAQVQGAAPNRRLAVQWRWPSGTGGPPVDVRAMVHEATGDLDVCYVATDALPGTSEGSSATAGLQGNLSIVLPYSCNSADLDAGLRVHYAHP